MGTCKLNPETCGQYEPYPDNSNINLSGNYKHTVDLKEQPKSKVKAKVKKDNIQGTMFE